MQNRHCIIIIIMAMNSTNGTLLGANIVMFLEDFYLTLFAFELSLSRKPISYIILMSSIVQAVNYLRPLHNSLSFGNACILYFVSYLLQAGCAVFIYLWAFYL